MKKTLGLLFSTCGLGLVASSAFAGSTTLGGSGWVATWPEGTDVQLTTLTDQDNTLVVSQSVTVDTRQIIPIVFQQIDDDAPEYIVLRNAQVSNQSGQDWGGYQFTLLGPTSGTNLDPRFTADSTGLTPPAGFTIGPFGQPQWFDADRLNPVDAPRSVVVGSGLLADGQSMTAGTDLYLWTGPAAQPDRVFALKQGPTVKVPSLIPFPSALWSGLSTMAGLATWGAVHRRIRRAG